MSSNSWPSTLQTAPIVSALRGRESPLREGVSPPGGRGAGTASAAARSPCFISTPATSALQVAEFELADLDLVTVGEQMRLDPLAVDVSPVQRAEVVDVEAVTTPDEQRVVAGDGDVVEEDRGVGRAPDAHPLLIDPEALPRASAAADHQ